MRSFYGMVAAGAAVLALNAGTGSAQAQPQQPPPLAPVLQNYKPVTEARLKKPEDGDWLMIRRTYDGWGYSIDHCHRPHDGPDQGAPPVSPE